MALNPSPELSHFFVPFISSWFIWTRLWNTSHHKIIRKRWSQNSDENSDVFFMSVMIKMWPGLCVLKRIVELSREFWSQITFKLIRPKTDFIWHLAEFWLNVTVFCLVNLWEEAGETRAHFDALFMSEEWSLCQIWINSNNNKQALKLFFPVQEWEQITVTQRFST